VSLVGGYLPLARSITHSSLQILEGAVGSSFTGCVLAFSSGTFVCIALSDLLPEVQFHSHDRLKLFLRVILTRHGLRPCF